MDRIENNKEHDIVVVTLPFPGAKRPAQEGAKLGFWDCYVLEEDNFRVSINPDLIYIFVSWASLYGDIINVLKSRGVNNIGVLWTSSIGEVDLTPVERRHLSYILNSENIKFIWFGDKRFWELYPENNYHSIYPMQFSPQDEKYQMFKQNIITLMCPTKPNKNILNQLLAVSLFQKSHPEYVLHTNVTGYFDILENKKNNINYIHHGWVTDEEYRELILKSKVNLAVSYTETFNYQVAEAALMGTPSVTSRCIPVPGYKVDHPNDPYEIARSISDSIEEGRLDGFYRSFMSRMKNFCEECNKSSGSVISEIEKRLS